jgi:MarR family transcriptional regulator, organic hydroperoxide resistance regulator
VIDRKQQIDGLIQYFLAGKHKFLPGNIVLSARFQIPNSQWIVMRIIEQNEGMAVKELSRTMGISSSAATQLIDPLVKKGYLVCEKNPEDRRAVKIRLTEKARKIIKETQIRMSETTYAAFDILTDEELTIFCELGRKIVTRMLKQ